MGVKKLQGIKLYRESLMKYYIFLFTFVLKGFISYGAYASILTKVQDEITTAVKSIFSKEGSGEFVFDNCPQERSQLGGKASNLERLQRINGIKVPSWAVLTTGLFKDVVTSESSPVKVHFEEFIELYEKGRQKQLDSELVFQAAAKVIQAVNELDFPESLKKALEEAFLELSNEGTKPLAVRSSATTEDLPDGSFAGLFDSYLNQKSVEGIISSIKKCWTSIFNQRALQYLLGKSIAFDEVQMGVIIQEMVKARVSGTAFSVDITSGYEGFHIMASDGLEGIVGGDISGDSYLFTPGFKVLKRISGSRDELYVPADGAEGLKKVKFHRTQKFCFSSEEALKIATCLKNIFSSYQSVNQGHVDTEFAISDEGTLYFLQVRPVINLETEEVVRVEYSKVREPRQLVSGKHAIAGAIHGKVKVIRDFNDLETGKIKIEPQDIVVAHKTENQWTKYLTQFSGIVTEEGNPTAHPVLICREKGIPCVVGVDDVVNQLAPYDGQKVTIDGFKKSVLLGHLPLEKVDSSLIRERFATVKEEEVRTDSQVIPELERRGLITAHKKKQWVVNPGTPLSGALVDIIRSSYPLREVVINETGVKPAVSLKTEQIAIEKTPGEVNFYDEWWVPTEQQTLLCQDMSPENCELFHKNLQKHLEAFLGICDEFELTPENWSKFEGKLSTLYAYKLLGILEPVQIIRTAYRLASAYGVPQFMYDEFTQRVQASCPEEDLFLERDAADLAGELLKICEQELLVAKEIKLEALKEQHGEFYERLVNFSKHYKMTKTENWIDEPQVGLALDRVKDYLGKESHKMTSGPDLEDQSEEYFIDNSEMRSWIALSVWQKVQRNNFHHMVPRGLWSIRAKLLELGQFLVEKSLLNNAEEILRVSSKQVANFIKYYEVNK